MQFLLYTVVIIGMVAVGLAFVVLLPFVGQLLASIFAIVFTEKFIAKRRGVESGTVLHKPTGPRPKEPPKDPHTITPTNVYVSVYVALLILTVMTVGVSELGLPMRLAIIGATVVACIKASLVIAWFMHLKSGPRMHQLVAITSVFFMLVFFSLTMADVSTRNWGLKEQDFNMAIQDELEAGRQPPGWSASTPQESPEDIPPTD